MIALAGCRPSATGLCGAEIAMLAKRVPTAMRRTECWKRQAAIVSLALLLLTLPACSASGGPGLLRRQQSGVTVVPTPEPLPQPPPYVAYRPVLTQFFRPKTFTLSNYAGANYPSVAPGAVVTPTDFRTLTGRPLRRSWFGSGTGW